MKCGVSTLGCPLSLLLGAVLAGPAQGAPITVFFDGPHVATSPSGPEQHRGLSLEQALATGLEMASIPTYTVDGSLSFGPQSADGRLVPEGDPAPNEVLNEWVVANDFGDFGNDVYLLFAGMQNALGSSYNVDFTDEGCSADDPLCSFEQHDRTGLVIDPAATNGAGRPLWRIVTASEDDETFHYLGILLDDFMNAGQACGDETLVDAQTCVALLYFLENPEAQLQPNGEDGQLLPLAQVEVLMAVVPEPGTGALLGLGLTVLAGARRRSA